jgi:NADH dehydrogenase
MQVEGASNLWALGDCALIPNPAGEGFCPPTAQFASRQAATCAANIVAAIQGREKKEFRFTELGKMAALGHRQALARLFDRINLRGILGWVFWRTAYWSKLPGTDRKIKVGVSWLMDLICPPELVQTKLDSRPALAEEYYEPGEIVIHEGDLLDRLYVVRSGSAESFRGSPDNPVIVNDFRAGQCFGAVGQPGGVEADVSVRCVEPLTVFAYRTQALAPLLSLPEMSAGLERLQDASRTSEC